MLMMGPVTALAEPQCDIPDVTKKVIYHVLCGGAAPEANYRFEGPNFLKASVAKRLDDSAVQIHAYKMCREDEFSERLKFASLNAIQFIEILSVCTPERPDINRMMEASLRDMAKRMVRETCTPAWRELLTKRRSSLEKLIQQTQQSSVDAVYEKLKVRVDNEGNVFEAK